MVRKTTFYGFQVQQRPFQTRLKVTKTKRKPFFPPYTATGIPLPENLLPESDVFPQPSGPGATPEPTEIFPDPFGAPDHSETDKESSTLGTSTEGIKSYFPNGGINNNNNDDTDDDDSNSNNNNTHDNKHLGHVYFPADLSSEKPIDTLVNVQQFPSTTQTTTTTTTPTTTTAATTTTTTTITRKPEVFIGPVRPQRPTRQPDEVFLTSPRPNLPTGLPTTRQTTPRQHLAPGLVFDDRPVNVVTAATFRPPTKNPDVFDVVVTANQNFGGGESEPGHGIGSGKPHSNYPGN